MNLKIGATAFYGILLGVGGIMGFVKAGSVASLIMGSVSAMLMLGCAFAMYKQSVLAQFAAVVLCSLLTIFFAYRFLISYKFMPSGLMFVLSIALLALLCLKQKKLALN